MSQTRRSLGRGLSALIPATPVTGGSALAEIDIHTIAPNPRQPRENFNPDALQELANSIREHGLIQPLIVTKAGAVSAAPAGIDYYIVAGERRWRAAQLIGLDQVPVIVKETTEQALLELALVENVQRSDLNALEEAAAYQVLIDEFGLTQAQVAERVGKARVTVTNTLRLLRLCDAVKQALSSGTISEAHARTLVALEDEDLQAEALARVIERELTVRQTEALVRRLLLDADEPEEEADDEQPDVHLQALQTALRERLGTKVEVNRNPRGRGRLVIHFYSDEELQTLYDTLVGD